jgi:translation initiation factor 1 (eIF-1/SUI1)
MADVEQPAAPSEPQARHVVYCGGTSLTPGGQPAPPHLVPSTDLPPAQVCTMPPEYCEYGGTVKKCQDWLQGAHPALYARLWSAAAVEAATAALSVDAQKRAAKDAQKKAAKAEAAEQRHADQLAHSLVTIRRIERNKRKFVTAVSGLEAFGLELKKVRPPLSLSLPSSCLAWDAGGGGCSC